MLIKIYRAVILRWCAAEGFLLGGYKMPVCACTYIHTCILGLKPGQVIWIFRAEWVGHIWVKQKSECL